MRIQAQAIGRSAGSATRASASGRGAAATVLDPKDPKRPNRADLPPPTQRFVCLCKATVFNVQSGPDDIFVVIFATEELQYKVH